MQHACYTSGMQQLTRLRELRVRAGLTQIDLADRSAVARTTISRLEGGNPNASPTTLRKLARALRVKPYHLYEAPASEARPRGAAPSA